MEKKILTVIVLIILLFFVAFFLRKKKALSNWLLSVAAVLASLFAVEVVYRLFIQKKLPSDTTQPGALYVGDPVLGFKFSAPSVYSIINTFPKGDTVYNTTYTILNDTLPDGVRFNFRKGYKSNNSNKEVVFMGCSLTFGNGLADTQSLPYLYGAAANVSTLNMSCIGYGIHQVYQLFNEKLSHLDNHHRTFVYPFFYDHILRANGIYAWNSDGPFFDIEHDSLVNKGPLHKFKWLKGDNWSYYTSLFGTFRAIKDNVHKAIYSGAAKRLSEDDYKRCFMMMNDMAKKINRSGGHFIILDWANYNWNYKPVSDISRSKVDQQFQSLSKLGVQVVPVASIINMKDNKNYIPFDGHPSAAANEAIAKWLANNIW